MFDLYKVDVLVKNEALKKSFSFSLETINATPFLRIKKRKSSTPILFYVNLYKNYDLLLRLLETPFFPSSTTILSQIGKRVTIEETTTERIYGYYGRYLTTLSNASIEGLITKYFRYKRIKVNSTGNVICSDKKNIEFKNEHPLIRYFVYLVTTARYEESVYKAIVKIFALSDNSDTLSNAFLECFSITKDLDLKLESLFTENEKGKLEPATYGESICLALQDREVLYGSLPWSILSSRSKVDRSLLSVVDVLQNFKDIRDKVESNFREVTKDILTAEASESYNKEILPVQFWSL